MLNEEPGWRQSLLADVNAPGPEVLTTYLAIEQWTLIALGAVLVLVLAARGGARAVSRGGATASPCAIRDRATSGSPPAPASSKRAGASGIPHASVCGGRSRCSTCRVRINDGQEALPPASPEERKVLDRIGVPPNVRLACQLRPVADVSVTPLLPPNVGPRDGPPRGGEDAG